MDVKGSVKKKIRKPLRVHHSFKKINSDEFIDQNHRKQKVHLTSEKNSKEEPLDNDDLEIARLEKLLGVNSSKSRSKSAAKLNREYELYEGISGNFGDFLLDLDNIINPNSNKRHRIHDKREVEDEGKEEEDVHQMNIVDTSHRKDHIFDDGNQEASDIETFEDVEDDDDDDDDDEESEIDSNLTPNEKSDSEMESEEMENDDMLDKSIEEGKQEGKQENKYYVPAPGEDIYGRIIDKNLIKQSTIKYVPPAARKRLLEGDMDQKSDAIRELTRQINGLMNRLSDQSKDNILIGIQNIYRSNSTNIVNSILKTSIVNACANSSQLMTNLIPLYAAIIAGLHITTGIDVGAYMIESFTLSLCESIDKYRQFDSCSMINDDHSKAVITNLNTNTATTTIHTKVSCNMMLLLVYFYNYRVVHHQLINDIMSKLIEESSKHMMEADIELLLVIIDHCGFQLRADDPIHLKTIISKLFSMKLNILSNSSSSESSISGRYQYMLDMLTDLKNNKSRRVQSVYMENVKLLRKWLGAAKSRANAINQSTSGDKTLHIPLKDLLDAENRGRWWKAGASWRGKEVSDSDNDHNLSSHSNHVKDSDLSKGSYGMKTSNRSNEQQEEKLNKLAQKLHMNTAIRKNIFFAMMTSRDVHDAFERISKIDLRGKQDRDIIRVLIECSAMEKEYNPFYSQLAIMLCTQNRQYKTTIQFYYWDIFKSMIESNDMSAKFQQRYMNLSKLLVDLVSGFHVPLAVLRTIDMSKLDDSLELFLQTFFTELFGSKTSDETFSAIFDRIATSTDYDQTRDTILLYLQTHFTSSHSLLKESRVKERRKTALSILQSMKVLDVAKQMDGKNMKKKLLNMDD